MEKTEKTEPPTPWFGTPFMTSGQETEQVPILTSLKSFYKAVIIGH